MVRVQHGAMHHSACALWGVTSRAATLVPRNKPVWVKRLENQLVSDSFHLRRCRPLRAIVGGTDVCNTFRIVFRHLP
jgi:hypothetical protein